MGAGVYKNLGPIVGIIRKKYDLNDVGLIGETGKNAGVRQIISQDPMITATELFDDLTVDAVSIQYVTDDKGIVKMIVAKFEDGSRVNLRYTSKSGSPDVDIGIVNYEGIRSQKIHIEKGDK